MACKILHIGVFFDGTGNNKDNDAADDSQSNIAKLSDLYLHETTQTLNAIEHRYEMIYIEGIGTTAHDRHFIRDKTDKGGGGGGAERINKALDQVKALLEKYPAGNDDGMYRDRIIDVFGFSRGAAQARDFINTFYAQNNDYWKIKKVHFNFVGLYDTVGSFGIAGDNINYKPKDPSKYRESYSKENEKDENFEKYNFNLAGRSAEKIVHMVASDEVRKNFPLSSLRPISGTHDEWIYGGVHSDVGGGYPPLWDEPHGYMVGIFHSRTEVDEAIAHEKQKRSSEWRFVSTPIGNNRTGISQMYRVMAYSNRKVPNDITFITLFRMHEIACEYNVPFKPLTQSVPSTMAEYNSHTKEQPSNAMSYTNIEILKEKYYHRSAVDQEDIDTLYDGKTGLGDMLFKDSPDAIGGNDTRYVKQFDGKKLAKREIYSNDSSDAILPL